MDNKSPEHPNNGKPEKGKLNLHFFHCKIGTIYWVISGIISNVVHGFYEFGGYDWSCVQ
jgi:hypothetical protein